MGSGVLCFDIAECFNLRLIDMANLFRLVIFSEARSVEYYPVLMGLLLISVLPRMGLFTRATCW